MLVNGNLLKDVYFNSVIFKLIMRTHGLNLVWNDAFAKYSNFKTNNAEKYMISS